MKRPSAKSLYAGIAVSVVTGLRGMKLHGR
jgi:hypothetical protein